METKQKRKKNTIAEDEEERNKQIEQFFGKEEPDSQGFFVQPSFTLLLFSIFVDVHVDVGKDQLELLGKEKS